MKAYIISVAGAAVLSAVVNMLSPERWNKYISVLTGLVVAVSIGRPIFGIINSDMLSDISIEADGLSDAGMEQFYAELRSELEARVSGDIKTRLKEEFGTDCEVKTEVGAVKDGKITGVRRITIYGGHLDYTVSGRLREIYGAEEVIINGDKKLYQKTE